MQLGGIKLRNNRKKRIEKRKFKKNIITASILSILIVSCLLYYNNSQLSNKNTSSKIVNENVVSNTTPSDKSLNTEDNNNIQNEKNEETKDEYSEVLLSAVGDCTLGTDTNFGWNTFNDVFNKNNGNYSYFFKNVIPFFENDDITLANLETTFTVATVKSPKTFNFKGPPEYVKILTKGSIEGVNIANNHIYDYNEEGFNDTKKILESESINYFGEGTKWITTIKGHKFGFLGYRGWSNTLNLELLKKDIEELKSENCIIIINFHWGNEGHSYPNENQKKVAHFAIDNGADLIIGHHPHVIQGIEQYKGKFIAYSLANFCFGGNSNPRDKRTFILQTNFKFKNDELTSYGIKVIPCSVSSMDNLNDYCPTPLNGDRKSKLLSDINQISPNAGFEVSDNFFYVNIDNTSDDNDIP